MKRVITFFLTLLMIYHPGIFAAGSENTSLPITTRSLMQNEQLFREQVKKIKEENIADAKKALDTHQYAADALKKELQQAQAQVNTTEKARTKSSTKVDKIKKEISIIETNIERIEQVKSIPGLSTDGGIFGEGNTVQVLTKERNKLLVQLTPLKKDLQSAQDELKTLKDKVTKERKNLVAIKKGNYHGAQTIVLGYDIAQEQYDKSKEKYDELIKSQKDNVDAKALSARVGSLIKWLAQSEIGLQDRAGREISQADLFLANINVLQTRLKISDATMGAIEREAQSRLELTIMGKYLRTNLKKMSHDIASTLCESARACLKNDNVFEQRTKKIIKATIEPGKKKATKPK